MGAGAGQPSRRPPLGIVGAVLAPGGGHAHHPVAGPPGQRHQAGREVGLVVGMGPHAEHGAQRLGLRGIADRAHRGATANMTHSTGMPTSRAAWDERVRRTATTAAAAATNRGRAGPAFTWVANAPAARAAKAIGTIDRAVRSKNSGRARRAATTSMLI